MTKIAHPKQYPNRIHLVIRSLVVGGVATFVCLEFQRRLWPGLLPFPSWKPVSSVHRWFGIASYGLSMLAMLSSLLLSPIYTYDSFKTSAVVGDRSSSWVDLAFVLFLYLSFLASLIFGALSSQVR